MKHKEELKPIEADSELSIRIDSKSDVIEISLSNIDAISGALQEACVHIDLGITKKDDARIPVIEGLQELVINMLAVSPKLEKEFRLALESDRFKEIKKHAVKEVNRLKKAKSEIDSLIKSPIRK